MSVAAVDAPRRTGRFVSLSGDERLFLSGQPARCSARDIVATLTSTPVVAPHVAQCSASVASGVARTWATSAASASRPIRRRPAGPRGGGDGAGLVPPLPPPLDRAEPDAEEAGRLGLGKPGVDGSQQPLAEVGRVLLHPHSLP